MHTKSEEAAGTIEKDWTYGWLYRCLSVRMGLMPTHIDR